MKKTMITALTLAIGLLASAQAKAQNIGFVDMTLLERKMTAYQGIIAQRDKTVKAYTKKFQEIEQKLKEEEMSIGADKDKLSQAEVGKRIDAFKAKVETFRAQQEEFAKQMQNALLTALKEIQDEAVTPVLKEVALKKKYDAILNLNQALYVDPKNDVTDYVISKVNAKLPKVDMPKINLSATK